MTFRIAPSILSADFARLGDEVRAVERAGADLIHFDVMDNHYVPNLTVGPLVCAALKPHVKLPLDVHLMVKPVDAPGARVRQGGREHHQLPSRGLGPRRSHHRPHPRARLQGRAGAQSRRRRVSWLDHTLEKLDLVLLMSVNPGFGGQQFIPSVLPKIAEVRRRIDALKRDIWLEVDGGVKTDNIAEIARAGADTFVAGSAIFELQGSTPPHRSRATLRPRPARRKQCAESVMKRIPAAPGLHRIPCAEARADLYTPLAVYLKLANAPYSYLLESVVGGERFGRYSFIGLPAPSASRRAARTVRRLVRDARGTDVCLESVDADPFEYARAWLKRHRVAPVPAALRFGGGLAGYFGYESGAPRRAARARRAKSPIRSARPTCCCWFRTSSRWSTTCSASSTSWSTPTPRSPTPCAPRTRGSSICARGWRARCPKKVFLKEQRASRAARMHLHRSRLPGSGAALQGIHLRRRCACRCRSRSAPRARSSRSPLALYRALRGVNPSPYMYYFDFGDHHVVGASPEILVRLAGDTVTLRPIAGTRPRGATPEEDAAVARRSCSPIRRSAPST